MSRFQGVIVISLLAIAAGPACVRKVKVPELLPVKAPVSTDQLVNRINAYGETESFSAQTDISVRDYFTGKADRARDFPSGTGLIRFARPERVRMRVTFFGKEIADMTSDGREFRLAVFYPDSRRMFVHGSNLKEYQRLEAEQLMETKDPRLKDAGALANIRPQHITDAFIIKPIELNGLTEYFREEVRQREPDSRPGRQGRMVERTYYVLYVLERKEADRLYLRRKFWFDRTLDGAPLARQQTFENGDGRLASDIFYANYFLAPNSRRPWPQDVSIERRNDGYTIKLVLERDSVEVDPQLPPGTFVLENTNRLKEVNLDEPRNPSATANRAPRQ